MEIINRYQQLNKAYQALENIQSYLDLDFDEAEELRNQLNAAQEAVQKEFEDVEQNLNLLNDAADLIIRELNKLDVEIDEVDELVAMAEHVKQEMPDL